jgi:hypothetical protein
MPEFEELRLRVTLDDQASAQLARLRTELSQLGGGQQAQGFERLGGQTRQMTALMRPLATGSLSARSAMTALSSVIGPLGIAIAGLGGAFYAQTQKLKTFAEGMLNIDAKARALGIDSAQYENLERQFRRMGLSNQEGHAVISSVVKNIADLNRDGSQLFKRLMESTTDQDSMRGWIRRLTGFVDQNDWAGAINEVVDGVNRAYESELDRLQRSGVSETRARAMAADLVRNMLTALNLPEEGFQKITGRLNGVTREIAEDHQRRMALSRAYMDQYNQLAENFNEFWRGMQTGLLEVMTEINKYFGESTKSAEEWGRDFGAALSGILRRVMSVINGIEKLTGWIEKLKSKPLAALRDAGVAAARTAVTSAAATLGIGGDAEARRRAEEEKDRAAGFADVRQFGGPVTAGHPYLVGEGGPETFMPGGREMREQLIELRDNTEALEEQTTQSRELSDQLRALNDFLLYRKMGGALGPDGGGGEARAGGGAAAEGKPYVVGESGPEVFVPQSSGTIQSNRGMSAEQAVGWGIYGAGIAASAAGFTGASSVGHAVSRAGKMEGASLRDVARGVIPGMGVLETIKKDSEQGHQLRTKLRAMLGIDDPGEEYNFRSRQGGGAVVGGQGYVVGESGPEIFTPQAGGSLAAVDPRRYGRRQGEAGEFNAAAKTGEFGPPGDPSVQTRISLKDGQQITVHKDTAERFQGFLNEMIDRGYPVDLSAESGAGGYYTRKKRGRAGRGSGPMSYSSHSWGTAADINVARNLMEKETQRGKGTTDMPEEVEETAWKHGLSWGARFGDPMHFEAMSAKAWASKRRQLASRNRPTHPTAERAALDQAAGEENVVKGTSTVSISIKERAQQWKNMKSILKKTKIARKSQMEEASDGPTSSGDDGGSSDDSAEAKT